MNLFRLRALVELCDFIVHGREHAREIERAAALMTATMSAITAGAARADTITCPTCRRAWPIVTLIGRTRCPNCGTVMLGWQ